MHARLALLCGVLSVGLLPAHGAAQDLIMTGGTMTLGGVHRFGTVRLTAGARLVVPPFDGVDRVNTGNLVLIADSITVDATSSISARGAGYSTVQCGDGRGPSGRDAGGAGGCSVRDSGGGGAHFGRGGRGTRDFNQMRRSTTANSSAPNGRAKTATLNRVQSGSVRNSNVTLQKVLGGMAAAAVLLLVTARLGVQIPLVSALTDSIFESQTASLTVRGEGELTAIFINDQPLGEIPAGTRLPYTAEGVPAGKPIRVRVVGSWGENPPQTLTLEPGEPKVLTLIAGNLDSTDTNRLPSSDQSGSTTAGQLESNSTDSKGNPAEGEQLSLSFRVYPNGKGTLIRVNGQEFTADASPVKVPKTPGYSIQVQRQGWKTTEGGFDLPKVLELRGMLQFDLSPLDGTPHGDLHVANRQGWDITISNVSSGELIHRDRVDQDEKLYPLPTGTYQVALRDSGTGTQLEPSVINITNNGRADLP